MPDLPIEQLLPRANYSIYTLVRMASQRALELSDGKRCLADNSTTEKFTTMALEEIAQGKVELKSVSTARLAIAKASERSEEN